MSELFRPYHTVDILCACCRTSVLSSSVMFSFRFQDIHQLRQWSDDRAPGFVPVLVCMFLVLADEVTLCVFLLVMCNQAKRWEGL